MGAPAWDEDLLKTSYLYHGGGREHNQTPLTGLVADSDTRHNERANVLMSDGAIKTTSRALWLELGFGEELPDYLPRHDPYGPPPSMMEPGASEPPPPHTEEPPPPPDSEPPPPGMEPGMQPAPAPGSAPPGSPGMPPPTPPGSEGPPS
jgi:prepilin-type processing-associated H-X9-DG protein